MCASSATVAWDGGSYTWRSYLRPQCSPASSVPIESWARPMWDFVRTSAGSRIGPPVRSPDVPACGISISTSNTVENLDGANGSLSLAGRSPVPGASRAKVASTMSRKPGHVGGASAVCSTPSARPLVVSEPGSQPPNQHRPQEQRRRLTNTHVAPSSVWKNGR